MKKRNIRQIGQIRGNRSIYIEDYAMSYLKQMAEPDVPYARMAVLVGEQEKEAKEEAVCVYGVLDIPSGGEGIGYQMDSIAWTRLYAEMGQHFPHMEIVGWYLTGEDLVPEKNEWLLRFHRENFAGEHKIFFYYNPSELEEIGYFYEEGQLKPQSGYYIFYEKNEAMQNLLVTKHQEETGWRQPGTWRERLGEGQDSYPEARGKVSDGSRNWEGEAYASAFQSRGEAAGRDGSDRREEYTGWERGEAYSDRTEAYGNRREAYSDRRDRRETAGRAGRAGRDGRGDREIRGNRSSRQGGFTGGRQPDDPQGRNVQAIEEKRERNSGRMSSYLAGMATAVAVLALCVAGLQYFDRLDGLEEAIHQLTGNLSEVTATGGGQAGIGEGEEKQTGKNKETGKGQEERETEEEKAAWKNESDGTEEEKIDRENEKDEKGGEAEQKNDAENGEENDEGDKKKREKKDGNENEGEDEEEEENDKNLTGKKNKGSVLEVETLPGGILANPAQTDADSEQASTEIEGKTVRQGKTETREETTGQEKTGAGNETSGQGKTEAGKKTTGTGQASTADPEDEDTAGIEPIEDTSSDTVQSPKRYTVRAGDTLSGICRTFYQDLSMLDTLMQVNELSDPNGLLEGEVLILP